MAQTTPGIGTRTKNYLVWVRNELEKNRCRVDGKEHAPDEPHNGFVSASALDAYMKREMPALLHETFERREIPVSVVDITPNYIRAFATLLFIGSGQLIQHFVDGHELKDDRLPVAERPLEWPGHDTDPSWQNFRDNQWIFFPVKLDRGRDKHNHHAIVPFLEKTYLNHGGSSRLYRVLLHRDFDLIHTHNGRPETHRHYVLKTYEGPSAEAYHNTETRNFFRLRDHHGTCPAGIINCYSSYKTGETYNIIMEYAEGGSLKSWMKDRQEPKGGPVIATYWRSFIGCMQGLERIHRLTGGGPVDFARAFEGFHQDVCPENILLVRDPNPDDPDFPWLMRLADLGLSHFKLVEQWNNNESIPDVMGRETYTAPESYRRSKFDQSSERPVTQSIDIWALGCVILVFATWLVQGQRGVESFQTRRIKETMKVSPNAGDRFHDGNVPNAALLKSVTDQIFVLREDMRKSDMNTGPMLDLACQMLQIDPTKRPLIDFARQAAEGEILFSRNGTSTHCDTPTLDALPIEARSSPSSPLSTFATTSTSHNALAPLIPDEAVDLGFEKPTATISTPIIDQPTSSRIAELHGSAQDSVRKAMPLRKALPRGDRIQTGQDGDNHTASRSNRDLAYPTALSSPALSHKWDPPSISHQADCLEKLPHRPERLIKREDTLLNTEVQSPASDSWAVLPGQTDVQSPEELPRASSKSGNIQGTDHADQLPVISYHEAERWASSIASRPFFWKSPLQLGHSEYLANLQNRDATFLIDDGISMESHWQHVAQTCKILASILNHHDKNRPIRVCFMNASEDFLAKSPASIVKRLAQHDVDGMTNIDVGLKKISSQCDTSVLKRSSALLKTHGSCENKSIYVLTDAAWQGGANAAKEINWICETLVKKKKKRLNFGIQFIRFGNDQRLASRLQDLDDGKVGLFEMDIVDTTYWQGNVLKILLGSFKNYFDGRE